MKISNKLKFIMQLSKTEAVLSRKFSGQGLGFGDLMVMYAISQTAGGKIRRTDLAEQVGLTASGVTRLLIPLEKIGVIKREAHERDARVSYTVLTPAGKELLENSIKDAEQKCEYLIPETEAKKLDQLSPILESIAR